MNSRGYCIFIDTLCQGPVHSVSGVSGDDPDATEAICVFPTEREAQLEIVDFMMIRLQQFIDGGRDFEDAVALEEYVVEVQVLPDGTIVDGDGNKFGQID
ncbi:MAG: hypothetical protein V4584_10885 [Verrucomicrobiota bacterium]